MRNHFNTRLTIGAIAVASAFSQSVLAADPDADVIVVTATRFAEADPRVPASISVITRKDIAQSPATNVPELLRALPGVEVRPLYGPMGLDATVDIRGSGETAGSNTLVLIDGHRINPVDMTAIQWGSIPVDSIQRIEVIRGSGTVLYGDRASAGVINIITDRSGKPKAAARAEAGSYGYRSLDASAAGNSDGLYASIAAHDAKTDGYRDNSDARQTSASVNAGYRSARFDVALGLSAFDQEQGLPSQLTQAEFDATPKLASTPKYRVARKGYRVQPSAGVQISTDHRFEIDLSHTDETLDSVNPDWFLANHRRVRSLGIAPRFRLAHAMPGALSSETVTGADLYKGDFNSINAATPNLAQAAEQSNLGVFAQNTTRWSASIDSTLGYRSQSFRQQVSDQGSALDEGRTDRIDAWEIGAGYRPMSALRTYAKLARNFRLPNADELFAFDCSAWPAPCTTLFNGTLEAQTGRLLEAGFSFKTESAWMQASIFRQDNTNEIGYISANGKNANLDPTRRQGFEWEGKLRLGKTLALRASLTRQSAEFTEGPYAGKTIPLVATHKESIGAIWSGGAFGSHTLNLNRNGGRHFGGDFNNAVEKMSGYSTADYLGEWKAGMATLGLRINNLTGEKYSANGYLDFLGAPSYYPADPRTVFVSAKVEFF